MAPSLARRSATNASTSPSQAPWEPPSELASPCGLLRSNQASTAASMSAVSACELAESAASSSSMARSAGRPAGVAGRSATLDSCCGALELPELPAFRSTDSSDRGAWWEPCESPVPSPSSVDKSALGGLANAFSRASGAFVGCASLAPVVGASRRFRQLAYHVNTHRQKQPTKRTWACLSPVLAATSDSDSDDSSSKVRSSLRNTCSRLQSMPNSPATRSTASSASASKSRTATRTRAINCQSSRSKSSISACRPARNKSFVGRGPATSGASSPPATNKSSSPS
mmetsp:Transcript_96761/g.258662  ORF Transcript_96761/g.258662 Transcript_96761/m.258662 type:complete len:285 (-) Transcript_96761:467-1321(-)